MVYVLLIVILVLLLVGGLPSAPWGGWHSYGYYPSGLGLILLVVVIVLLVRGG